MNAITAQDEPIKHCFWFPTMFLEGKVSEKSIQQQEARKKTNDQVFYLYISVSF